MPAHAPASDLSPPCRFSTGDADRRGHRPAGGDPLSRHVPEGRSQRIATTIASCTKSGTMNSSCWPFVSPTGWTPIGGHLGDIRPETCIRVCLSTDRLNSSSVEACGAGFEVAAPFRLGIRLDLESGAGQPSSTDGSHSESAGTAWTMASATSIATKNGALPMATSLNGRCLAMPWMT